MTTGGGAASAPLLWALSFVRLLTYRATIRWLRAPAPGEQGPGELVMEDDVDESERRERLMTPNALRAIYRIRAQVSPLALAELDKRGGPFDPDFDRRNRETMRDVEIALGRPDEEFLRLVALSYDHERKELATYAARKPLQRTGR